MTKPNQNVAKAKKVEYVEGTEVSKSELYGGEKSIGFSKCPALDVQPVKVRHAYSKTTKWNGYFVEFLDDNVNVIMSSGEANTLGLLVDIGNDTLAWGFSNLGVAKNADGSSEPIFG